MSTDTMPYTNIIKPTAVPQLRWSAAMSYSHLFNLHKQQFVCNERQRIWDYKTDQWSTSGVDVSDSAYPCHDRKSPSLVEFIEGFVQRHLDVCKLSYKTFPSNFHAYICVSLSIHDKLLETTLKSIRQFLWPVFDKTMQQYTLTRLRMDGSGVDVFRSEHVPPIGFRRHRHKDEVAFENCVLLQVEGLNYDEEDELKKSIYSRDKLWFFISTGQTEQATFGATITSLDTVSLPAAQ